MPASFLEAAYGLIAGLKRAGAAARSNDVNAARAALADCGPTIEKIVGACTERISTADSTVKGLVGRVNELAAAISKLNDQLKDTDQQITDLNAAIKDARTRQMLGAQAEVQIGLQISMLQISLSRHKARLEEVRKWWWVPIYGTVISVECLVDDDIGGLKIESDQLNKVMARNKQGTQQLSDLTSSLKSLNDKLESSRQFEKNANAIISKSNADVAVAKARVAFLQEAQHRLGLVRQYADALESDDLDDLKAAIDDLGKGEIKSDDFSLADARNGFEAGLLQLSIAIDQGANFLTFTIPTANVIEISNGAAYVAKCRIATMPGNNQKTTAWTDNFPVLQSVRIDLRGKGFTPSALIRIEGDVMLGPDLHSGPIMFVDGDAEIRCSAKFAGTVFDAGLNVLT